MLIRRSLLSLLALLCSSSPATAAESRVYFGTYTKEGESQGIYHATFDDSTGQFGELGLAAEMKNPSFLAVAPSGKTLYAVSEVAGANGEGEVSAFRILESGALELINTVRAGGGGPCHVSLSPDGKTLAVANYGGGSVASYRVAEDGELSEPVTVIQHVGSSVHPTRQKGPHAHSINFSPDGRFAYAADLGTDRIYRYAVDPATGALTASGETVIAPASGPRHFAFRPDGAFAYLINEMTLMMTAFRVDKATGELTELQSLSTLPPGTEKVGSTAEVVAHPTGRFLYGSNRGHDSIVAYAIDEASGELSYLANEPIRGKVPRNFAVSPSGRWLLAAGQQSRSVTVFAIDEATGKLTFADSEIAVWSPVCIRFVPVK
jgi:6-phosphogluconolactonase